MTSPSAKHAPMRLVQHFTVALKHDDKFNVDVLTLTPVEEGRRTVEIRGECASFLKRYFEHVATDHSSLNNLIVLQAACSSVGWLKMKHPDVYSRALELNNTP